MIAPDNYETKFAELREVMFGNLKCEGEDGFDPKVNNSLTAHLNEENMKTVV